MLNRPGWNAIHSIVTFFASRVYEGFSLLPSDRCNGSQMLCAALVGQMTLVRLSAARACGDANSSVCLANDRSMSITPMVLDTFCRLP